MSRINSVLLLLFILGLAVYTAFSIHTHREVSAIAPFVQVLQSINPQPTPTPTPVPIAIPVMLDIPSLQIHAPIEQVGLDAQQRMDVPKEKNNGGWYNLGYKPGEPGNAVIAGHYDWYDGRAVFYTLDKIQIGDTLTITAKDSTTYTYKVTAKQTYPYDKLPLEQLFGPAQTSNVILITCTGTFDKQTKNYSHRLVIYSTLIDQ